MQKYHKQFGFFNMRIMKVFVERNTSLSLQCLRRTRPRSIRSDFEEVERDRRKICIDAHRALGRIVRSGKLEKHWENS